MSESTHTHTAHLLLGKASTYPQKRKSSLEISPKAICFKKNQKNLIHFCMTQLEDIAWKFFGNKSSNQIGWPCKKIDGIWTSSVCYVNQFTDGGIISLHHNYVDSYIGEKHKEEIWIHHFAILQLFHPKYKNVQKIHFVHDNHSLFVRHCTHNEYQEHANIFNDPLRFQYVWLGERIESVYK